jgi:hypothetical protein
MALTVVVPCVTAMETPPSVAGSGKASGGLEAGPRWTPKMEKMDPRAIAPAGRPGAMKLAALTMLRDPINWA